MEQRNIIIAAVLMGLILIGYPFLLKLVGHDLNPPQQTVEQPGAPAPGAPAPTPGTPGGTAPPALATVAPTFADRATALAGSARVTIDSPRLAGSISLTGARVDDLVLTGYRETVDKGSPNIVLLSPSGTEHAYYANFGWLAGQGIAVPGPETVWQADGDTLAPDHPVTLSWDNGQGLVFSQAFAIDQDFLLTVDQKVENGGDQSVELFPFGAISRTGTPKTLGYYILHEGLIGVLGGTLKESKYSSVKDDGAESFQSTGGWLGITDKYWLVALVPDQGTAIDARFAHTLHEQTDIYQADYRAAAATLAPGASIQSENRLFAGAKEVRVLSRYGDTLGVPLFDRAVDFGWFWFLTKPIFYMLDYIFAVIGNFGVSILVLTVIIKGVLFPLANKSYRAMNRMKLLTPEMTKLRERFKDDKARLNQEMMALYKREKVNPAAGCLPILVQIPIFFALYKVLFVTIEMRHAPFFGWIHDLSAPDPTSILNLFGLLPYTVSGMLDSLPQIAHGPLQILGIGVWPIVMGITMWLQQKLNPAPPDPVQARIMMMLPIVFTFMLGHFAAGLVIYWAWNNTLSITQQRLIMWRMKRKP